MKSSISSSSTRSSNRSTILRLLYCCCCLVLCIVLGNSHGIRGQEEQQFTASKRVLPNDPVAFSQLRDFISKQKTASTSSSLSSLSTTTNLEDNPNTNYIFRGPGSQGVCVPTLLFGSFTKNMWCEVVNPYSGTPDIFFDSTILPSGEFSYECESQPHNHSLPYDDQMDSCKSIVGIRGFDENFLLYDMSYVVEAFSNGRIFLMRNTLEHMFEKATKIYYRPDLFRNIVKFDGHAKETGYASDGYDHLTFAQNSLHNNQLYVNGIYNITLNFIDGSLSGKNWYFPLDATVTSVLQLRMIREAQAQHIYSVALAKLSSTKYQIYFIQPESVVDNQFKVTKWTITVPEGNEHVNFDVAHQHGKFSPDAPMRIDPTFFFKQKLSTSRVLISIQTDTEVRIFEFSENDSNQKDIDFTTPDLLNTFYVAPEYTKITYGHLVAEQIRRPLSITRLTTCDNVQFPLSQNIFLVLGLSQTYDGPTNPIYRLTVHHIEEFYNYNFEKDFSNTANRAKTFSCSPSEFINANGVCEENVENYEVFDSEIISIHSRFMDVNHTTGSVPSYLQGGYLNPEVFCEMEFIGAGRPPNREECRLAAKNLTCEIDFFNGGMGDMRNLYSFFYGYWQQNIYVAKASSAMEIHAMALDIDLVKPQAYVSLKKLNRFKTLGNVIDVFISPNNQHLFVSVSRQKWEMEAKKRYNLVCNTLTNDPDNVFLKMFYDKCELVPPAPIDENQFAIASSSCIRGNVCGFFRKNQVRPSASKGTFVYRSLAEIPCILGSYCVAGIRIPCPIGYVCPDFAMDAPKKCDANYGYQSCYSQNLIAAYECPNGTLCTTDYSVPIPASPGHFVKKSIQDDGTMIINGLALCEEGDYCNLAREVILNPENKTLSVLLCPADTYCTNSSILQPSLCSFTNGSMDYCPSGTIEKDLCPAGFYCENPNSIKDCSLTQYCPEGSFTYSLCPEGYYCPNASIKIICPEGFFCRQGFIEPSQCSWFLSSCPEGSPTDRMTYGGLLLVLCLLLILACLYFAYEAAFKFYIKMSARQREENPHEASSLFSRAQKQQNYGSSFHEEQFTVDIGFQDLGLVLRGSGKKVLDGVTGEIKHGKLTAVMGLSGAGKSTFITTLSNRAYYGAQVGKVFVNGVEEPLSKYNRKIGFVPQDDIMIPSMTVEETLYFSAKTRLDANTPAKQINSIVNDVIKVLRLEDVRHSIIGDQEKRGISGGQKKRVNVGIELVSSPYVLFLDEPTSGLDSASSKEVCEALQAISSCGITVITVIHQPRYEIFNMFDNLLLLGKGGRTIYLGQVQRVEEYFKEIGFTKPPGTNLADFVIDVSAGLMERDDGEEFHPSDLAAIWDRLKEKYTNDAGSGADDGIAKHLPPIENESPTSFEGNIQGGAVSSSDTVETKSCCKKKSTPPARVNKFKNPRLPYFAQFWMCFKRSCTQLLRTLPSLVLDYALVFLCGAFLGLIYYNKVYIGPPPKSVYEMCPNGLEEICAQPLEDPIYATSSLMTLAMALMGAMSALRVFGGEYLVFYRESQTGLSTFCYFWAKDISLFIVNIFAPMVFLGIYYTTVAPRAPVYEYYYVLLLVYWTSYGLGYFISIVIQPNIAQLTAVVVVFIFNTFSGATTPLPTFQSMYFPINILPYLSYLTYSHENAYLIELKRYENIYDLSKSMKMMGYKWDEFYMSIYMMIVFGFIFRIVSFISLVCVKPSSFYNLAVIATHNFFSTQARRIFGLCRRSSSAKV